MVIRAIATIVFVLLDDLSRLQVCVCVCVCVRVRVHVCTLLYDLSRRQVNVQCVGYDSWLLGWLHFKISIGLQVGSLMKTLVNRATVTHAVHHPGVLHGVHGLELHALAAPHAPGEALLSSGLLRCGFLRTEQRPRSAHCGHLSLFLPTNLSKPAAPTLPALPAVDQPRACWVVRLRGMGQHHAVRAAVHVSMRTSTGDVMFRFAS